MLHPEFYKLAGRPWGLHRGKTEDSKEKIRSSWSKRAPLSFTLSGLFTKWRFYQIEGATQKHPSQLPVENNFSGSKSISFFFRTELDVLVTNDLHQLEDTECKKKKNPSRLQTDNDGDYAAARRSVTIILNLLNAAMKCIIHVYLTVPITEYKWIQRASPLFILNKSWINALLNALS